MKKVFDWFFKNTPANADVMNFALAFLRIFAGLMMIPYGWGKIERYETLKANFFGIRLESGMKQAL